MTGVNVAAWPSFFALMFKTSLHSGVFAMVGGLIMVPIVSLFTKKMEKAKVDEMFTCYEEKVEVTKKEALKDEE